MQKKYPSHRPEALSRARHGGGSASSREVPMDRVGATGRNKQATQQSIAGAFSLPSAGA